MDSIGRSVGSDTTGSGPPLSFLSPRPAKRLAKDSGDMWMAAASQDAQVELQNADKASLQGKVGGTDAGGAEEGRQQQHDPTEL